MGRMNWGRVAKEGQMRRWGSASLGGEDRTLLKGKLPEKIVVKVKVKGAPPETVEERRAKRQAEEKARQAVEKKRRAKLAEEQRALRAAEKAKREADLARRGKGRLRPDPGSSAKRPPVRISAEEVEALRLVALEQDAEAERQRQEIEALLRAEALGGVDEAAGPAAVPPCNLKGHPR
jgi:hypothetical protein